MAQNIAPGTRVNITIVKQPASVAAAKTLVRLLSKDPLVVAENKRHEEIRRTHLRHQQRGGRQWAVRVIKQRPVTGSVGETGTLLATVDVLRDLGSVQRFVQVTPA
jgi:hypothetical protein